MADKYVRLDQLNQAGLTDAEKIDALAAGLVSMALLLHRTRLGGSSREVDARFDADGMVLVPVPVTEPHEFDGIPHDYLACAVCTKGRYHRNHYRRGLPA
jgi:hypothetical protein